jgi:xanthine dehydrogenase small subunit
MKSSRDFVVFYLNGKLHEVRADRALLNLSDYLRKESGLTGTKIVCAEGDCGACSVLRAFPKFDGSIPRFEVINSCITRVAQMDGSVLVTIEGLPKDDELNEIQKALVECNGSQCGFCTPGFVMALADHFESRTREKNVQKLKNALTGNLCRCTGYQAILEAGSSVERSRLSTLGERYLNPETLVHLGKLRQATLQIRSEEESYLAPASIEELATMRVQNPEATILAAGTDLGVQRNKHGKKTPVLISLHLLADLYKLNVGRSEVSIGARVTLTEVREVFKDLCPSFSDFLNIFASPQIKNFATLVGNVANASPIADTPPVLLALNASVVLWDPATAKERKLPVEELFLSYKKLNISKGEIIFRIEIPIPAKEDTLYLKKISQRRDLDISTVNVAFWRSGDGRDIRLAVGGVAAIPMRLKETENYIKRTGTEPAAVIEAVQRAMAEVKPVSDLRGTSAYRRILLRNLLSDFLKSSHAGERRG